MPDERRYVVLWRHLPFPDNVVTLVQLKVLPQQLVETTFLWARRQHARIPFPYFRRALQIRAARLGLFVPQ